MFRSRGEQYVTPTAEPVCPYCHKHQKFYKKTKDGVTVGHMVCDNCHKEFYFTEKVTRTFVPCDFIDNLPFKTTHWEE